MAQVFDASSYFTRRQADLRYVRAPLTVESISAALKDENGIGTLPGSVLVPHTITGSEIAEQAIGLQHMLGDVRPPRIIPANDPLPALPDPLFPVGAQVTWMKDDGRLWINRNNADWEPTVRTIDLSGQLERNQFVDSIKPILVVDALPTIERDPGTLEPVNYKLDDIITLKSTRKLYQLIDAGGHNYDWDPIIHASRLDGKLSASQLDVDEARAAILVSGVVKTDMLDAQQVTFEKMAGESVYGDVVKARGLTSQHIDFTTMSGDAANINWITAAMLRASVVTTDKLIVGSFDNLMEDGAFQKLASDGCWSTDGGGFKVSADAAYARTGSGSAVKSRAAGEPAATDSGLYNRMVFDVRDGDKLYLEGWARQWGADGSATLRIYFYRDRACTDFVSYIELPWFTAAESASWKFKSGIYSAPAGARWGRVATIVGGHNTGIWAMDDLFVRKAIGSAFIDEISAFKITSGELDANLVRVKNLNADEITAGTLKVDRLILQKPVIEDAVVVNDYTIPAGPDAGKLGVFIHGSAGDSADWTIVFNGVIYKIGSVFTASRYLYLAIPHNYNESGAEPPPGAVYNTLVGGSDQLPDAVAFGDRQIVVATLENSQATGGVQHTTCHFIDTGNYMGTRLITARGDTVVTVAGDYDPETNSYVGVRVRKSDGSVQTRITHQFITTLLGNAMKCSMGIEGTRPYLWVGGALSVNPTSENNIVWCKKLGLDYANKIPFAGGGTMLLNGNFVGGGTGTISLTGAIPIYDQLGNELFRIPIS